MDLIPNPPDSPPSEGFFASFSSSSSTSSAAAVATSSNHSQSQSQQPQSPSRYESQKRRDWNTFGQYLRNHRPPLARGSLDALIGRLRAAYEENGGRPETNPFGSRAVRLYLREVRETQAKARGISYEKKKRKKPSSTTTTCCWCSLPAFHHLMLPVR